MGRPGEQDDYRQLSNGRHPGARLSRAVGARTRVGWERTSLSWPSARRSAEQLLGRLGLAPQPGSWNMRATCSPAARA
jgi:hypothetical protein